MAPGSLNSPTPYCSVAAPEDPGFIEIVDEWTQECLSYVGDNEPVSEVSCSGYNPDTYWSQNRIGANGGHVLWQFDNSTDDRYSTNNGCMYDTYSGTKSVVTGGCSQSGHEVFEWDANVQPPSIQTSRSSSTLRLPRMCFGGAAPPPAAYAERLCRPLTRNSHSSHAQLPSSRGLVHVRWPAGIQISASRSRTRTVRCPATASPPRCTG